MTTTHAKPLPDPREAATPRAPDTPPNMPPSPRHDARALTAGGRAAEIALDGRTYTLRITRAGKLILTR
jgi:hemin uptake protein HemP